MFSCLESREQVEQAANALLKPDQTYTYNTDKEFKEKIFNF